VDTSSAEKLRIVAQQLVQAREAQGISLEEIATKTFIPMRILKALEAGETFKLPEPIFVQGFIRRYAKLMELDGDALAKEIPLNTEPVAVDLIKEPRRPPLVDVIRDKSFKAPVPVKVMRPIFTYGAENPVSSSPISPKSDGYGVDRLSRFLPVIFGVGLASAIALTGVIAILRPKTPAVKPTQTPSTKPIVIKSSPQPSVVASPITSETPTPNPSPTSSPTPSLTPSPSVTSGPVKVDISLSDSSWIEVVVDGEVKFDGTMQKGATQSWLGQKDIQISSGNSGAVKVAYNQEPATVMGKFGQVETKKFSAKN
jgi:cytoskeleton protein RodZ